METESFFHIQTIGQLETADFPMGPESSSLYCRYDLVLGPDWELVAGIESSISQTASPKSGEHHVVLNLPIDFTLKSTNPYGWPQLVFSLYGRNWWGAEFSIGYARCHIPLPGQSNKLTAPISSPKCTTVWSAFLNYFISQRPELRDPTTLATGINDKVLQTETYGNLVISLQSIIRRTENQFRLMWS